MTMTDRELAGCALLPCPLCGEPAEWSVGSDNVHNAGATCKLCGLDLWDQGPGCMDRVTESWNRRAPSSEVDGRDGERYRWIRGRETVVDRYVTVMPTESERFDAAIDAAMEKEQP